MDTLKMIIAIFIALLLFGIGPAFAENFSQSQELNTPSVEPSN